MAVDTFVAYVGVYPSVEDAESDYQLVKDLHTKTGMLDAYDAAVIEKRETGKCASPRSMRRRLGLAEYSAVVLGWRRGSLWHCSPSQQ
jgi:hypothetical protein